jgi:hypothetical protein
MKKLSKRSVLLLASTMALAAFAMSGAANAATWSPNPASLTAATTGGLTLTGSTALGQLDVTCDVSYTGTGSGSGGSITGIVVTNCSGTQLAADCDVGPVGGALPWGLAVGGSSPSFNLGINGIDLVIDFDGGACALDGLALDYMGSVNGTWTNTGVNSGTYVLANAGPLSITLGGTPIGTALADGDFDVSGGILV